MQKINKALSLFLAATLLFLLCGGVAYAQDGSVNDTASGSQATTPSDAETAEAPTVQIVSLEELIPNQIAIAVAQGDEITAVTSHVDLEDFRLKGTDENGVECRMSMTWDFSTVDMDTLGLYPVTGTLNPPSGLAFSPELVLPEPTFTVSVQIPGSPDINSYSRGRGTLNFPWLLTEEHRGQLELFEVWLATDDVWKKLENGYAVLENGLNLLTPRLDAAHTYKLQVDYPSGKTGILTFTYDGIVLDCDYGQGDRDGDDSNGNTPPSVGQPPPKPDPTPDPTPKPKPDPDSAPDPTPTPKPEPTPKPDPTPMPTPNNKTQPPVPPQTAQTIAPANTDAPVFMGETNATSTTISGLRLRMMLEAEQGLQFSKQGISVTLSSEAVTALNIADDGVFSIEILRESNTAFYLGVLVNEESVTELVGTTISLPYTSSSDAAMLTLRHDNAETVTAGSYELQASLATFVVGATGQYTILEEATPTVASPNVAEQAKQVTTPILPAVLVVTCLLVLVGGMCLLKRRATK